jgi:hypothetical protein
MDGSVPLSVLATASVGLLAFLIWAPLSGSDTRQFLIASGLWGSLFGSSIVYIVMFKTMTTFTVTPYIIELAVASLGLVYHFMVGGRMTKKITQNRALAQ